MDYTTLPRQLIYKDRTDLKEFSVNCESTLEYRFYEKLLKRPKIVACDKKRDTILRIFNNAYYICTLILLEDDPRLYEAEYRGISENHSKDLDWCFHYSPMTMALVYNELKPCCKLCKCGKRIFDEFMQNLYENYQHWDVSSPEGKADFYELADSASSVVMLPSDTPLFTPRTITRKLIGEVFSSNDYSISLRCFTKDYDMDTIAECFKILGRTVEEKEALRESLRWDVVSFCDEVRKPSILAQLDAMDFSSCEHAIEQGMEARYSQVLFERNVFKRKFPSNR